METDRRLRPPDPDPVPQRDFGVRRTEYGELLRLLSRRVGRLVSKKTTRCQRHVRNDYARLLRPTGSSFSDRLSRHAWQGESPSAISGEQMSSRELTQSAQVNSNANGRLFEQVMQNGIIC